MFSNTPNLYITYIYRRPKSGESKVAILESPLLTFFLHLVIIPLNLFSLIIDIYCGSFIYIYISVIYLLGLLYLDKISPPPPILVNVGKVDWGNQSELS